MANPPANIPPVQEQPAVKKYRFDVGIASSFPVFNLRDGLLTEVQSMIVRPTIPVAYHWRPVSGMLPELAKPYMDLYIRSAVEQLRANMPAGWSVAKARKVAIMLGVSRCVCTFLYKIGTNDLIAGESSTAFFNAVPTPEDPTAVELVAGQDAETIAAFDEDFELTELEKNVVAVVGSLAPGIVPVQGYSLIQCQHHYLSDAGTQSYKAFLTIEKQFWRSQAIKAWFDDDLDTCRDILWHKSCHPVSMVIKMNLAGSMRIKASLEAMGVGSAAARLPAYEPTIRACNTWVTVLSTVSNYFLAYGGKLDYFGLIFALEFVSQFPAGNAAVPAEIARTKYDADAQITYEAPTSINSRTAAIAWLSDIMKRNTPLVATAYGFYIAVSENTQAMAGEGIQDTLKSAFSLSKLRTQSLAAFMQGYEAFKDYSAFKARQRTEGTYTAISVSIQL